MRYRAVRASGVAKLSHRSELASVLLSRKPSGSRHLAAPVNFFNSINRRRCTAEEQSPRRSLRAFQGVIRATVERLRFAGGQKEEKKEKERSHLDCRTTA